MKKTGDADNNPKDADSATEHVFDPIEFDAAMAKWRGYLRNEMLAEGFATTEELMKDIRDR